MLCDKKSCNFAVVLCVALCAMQLDMPEGSRKAHKFLINQEFHNPNHLQ